MGRAAELLNELRIERAVAPPVRAGNRRALVLAAIAVGALLVAGSALWLNRPSQLIEVVTTRAMAFAPGPTAGASVLDATGYVTARRIATVSAKITGKVKAVLIEEGQFVNAGQIMATLDATDAEAQLRLSRLQLDSSRSQLGNLEAQLRHAAAQATRYDELLRAGFVGRVQAEQMALERDSLKAQLDTANRSVLVAEQQVRIAADAVAATVVRSPFSGVIIAKAAQPGEIVSPLSAGGGFTRTGIGTVVDMDSMEIEVNVNEALIGRVQPAMPVEAVLNAYPDWRIPAEVISAIPAADRNKATVKVRIGFKVKDKRIVPDMGVKVSLLQRASAETAPRSKGVRVAGAAITEREGKPVLFVVGAGGLLARRAVTLGREMGAEREVLNGISIGELAVLAPATSVTDGMRVRIASPAKL